MLDKTSRTVGSIALLALLIAGASLFVSGSGSDAVNDRNGTVARNAGRAAAKDAGEAAKHADGDRRNADGSTPLQWAVYEGDAAEVQRLLRAGADVSLANDYGATPMSLAAEVADTEILKGSAAEVYGRGPIRLAPRLAAPRPQRQHRTDMSLRGWWPRRFWADTTMNIARRMTRRDAGPAAHALAHESADHSRRADGR